MERIKSHTRTRFSSGGNLVCYGIFKCPFCGKEIERDYSTGRDQKSCGCHRPAWNRSHGDSRNGTRLYHIWHVIRQRIFGSTRPVYKKYGGRGITLCSEWQTYHGFRAWALSHGYADNLVIDRIDNDGNYEPSNCRWVTMKESNRNRTCVKLSKQDAITIRGMYRAGILDQKSLAERYDVSPSAIWKVVNLKSWVG